MKQLNEVGITKVPETFSEVHDAFYALQEHFGATNDQYHAFAMQSAQAYIEPFAAAFDLNKDFYVKLNSKDDIIELYDSSTDRLIETISGNELQELVKKLNMASGIFVNKKV